MYLLIINDKYYAINYFIILFWFNKKHIYIQNVHICYIPGYLEHELILQM